MNKQYFKTTEVVTVDNYPYGRLKCEATFGLEFDAKKGFRTTFQTVNPKDQRINKPKKSTYSPIILMYKNTENGHIEYEWLKLWNKTDVNKCAKVIAENFHLFTSEQIEYIYGYFLTHLNVDLIWVVKLRGAKKEDVFPKYYETPVKKLVSGLKTKENVFAEVFFDGEALEAEYPLK